MDQEKKASPKALAEQTAAAVPKEFQEAFSRVVQAGMKVMFSDETHELMLNELEAEGDLPTKIGNAISDLMLMLYAKSNKSMPAEIIIPAATYLMAQGADFLEQVTGQTMTPEIMAAASDAMVKMLMKKFGIDPDKFTSGIESAAAQGQQAQTAQPAPDSGSAEGEVM